MQLQIQVVQTPPNGNLQPKRSIHYDGRGILVFDNMFSKELTKDLSIMIQSLPFARSASFDNEFFHIIEDKFYNESQPLRTFQSTLEQILSEYQTQICSTIEPQRYFFAYAAAMRYGDHTRIHRDVNCRDCVTFLYYANPYWEPAWGGETMFFDESSDALVAIAPAPGRLVAFNASLLHRTGIPMRECPTTRYAMSVFFRCQNQSKPRAQIKDRNQQK